MKNKDTIPFLGGLGNLWLENGKQLSRNYRQGYRVYGINGCCSAINASGSGLGGHSGLYLVRKNRKDK